MSLNHSEIQIIKTHLENIERELAIIKRLIGVSTEVELNKTDEQIKEIRRQLLNKGIDEDIVNLVGIIPMRDIDYKKDIRLAISERHKY